MMDLSLEAVKTVQVGSQISGTVTALHADFNSTVRRGQVLAELDQSALATDVQQAQASLVRLQADQEVVHPLPGRHARVTLHASAR